MFVLQFRLQGFDCSRSYSFLDKGEINHIKCIFISLVSSSLIPFMVDVYPK
jgi:hypothetical protein